MHFIKSILCITIAFFSSHISAMRSVDIYGKDPYRFGEIRVDELLNERDREEVETHLKKVAHGDYNYPIRRILIAEAVRLRLAYCSPDRFIGEAVLFNDYWLVKDLLDHGADADAKYCGKPIILQTTSKPIAQLLVQHDVDLSATGTFGTILHYCFFGDYTAELMSYYIAECGLDVHAKGSDREGPMAQGTPLHYLVFHSGSRSEEIVIEKAKTLIGAGADLHAKTKYGFTPYDIIGQNMSHCSLSSSGRAELLALLNPDNQSLQEKPENSEKSERQNDENSEDECSICFERLLDEKRYLACAHVFHPACVVPWLQTKSTCPMCRKEIPGENGVMRVDSDNSSQVSDDEMFPRSNSPF